VTNTDGANLRLRAAPRSDGEIVKRLGPGWQVTILAGPVTDDRGTAWVRLEHAGTTGYAAAAYVAGSAAGGGEASPPPATRAATPAPSPPRATPSGQRLVVLEAARLRTEPGLDSTIVARLSAGTIVDSTGRAVQADGYRWVGVRAVGRDGWIVASALGDAPGRETGRQLAAAALSQVGRRYVWGGETPTPGFDCSGLVRYVVKQVTGIDLTHVLARQAEAGSPVERDQLAAGDLVFFENTYKPGLSHVGFYIGDGQFVSAQNERVGVVRGQMDATYWRTRYYGARRLAE
jgi:cell wall-associated NlpC family hydrolase